MLRHHFANGNGRIGPVPVEFLVEPILLQRPGGATGADEGDSELPLGKGQERVAFGAMGMDQINLVCLQEIAELVVTSEPLERVVGIEVDLRESTQPTRLEFFGVEGIRTGEDPDLMPGILKQRSEGGRICRLSVPPVDVAANEEVQGSVAGLNPKFGSCSEAGAVAAAHLHRSSRGGAGDLASALRVGSAMI